MKNSKRRLLRNLPRLTRRRLHTVPRRLLARRFKTLTLSRSKARHKALRKSNLKFFSTSLRSRERSPKENRMKMRLLIKKSKINLIQIWILTRRNLMMNTLRWTRSRRKLTRRRESELGKLRSKISSAVTTSKSSSRR